MEIKNKGIKSLIASMMLSVTILFLGQCKFDEDINTDITHARASFSMQNRSSLEGKITLDRILVVIDENLSCKILKTGVK